MKPYFYPAKLIKYNQKDRTATIHIEGLTDGSDGLTARLAYPIGDDDLDTERELLPDADVYVFFEQGDLHAPVIAFYRSHGKGRAVADVRRIRQKNIEVLARSRITLAAQDLIEMTASEVHITAKVTIDGDITHNGNTSQNGNQTTNGKITATADVVGGGKSLKGHTHSGVRSGSGNTGKPN